jgi:hypothetical protein
MQPEFGDLKGIGVEAVRAMLAEGKLLQLIGTRPRYFVSRQQDIAEGITWRDPELVREWMSELKKDEPVVVSCADAFATGCRTAVTLREAGFDASYMNVGHSGGRSARRWSGRRCDAAVSQTAPTIARVLGRTQRATGPGWDRFGGHGRSLRGDEGAGRVTPDHKKSLAFSGSHAGARRC